VVHFYRNVWTAVPTGKAKGVAAMLKAIHAQEDAKTTSTQQPSCITRKIERLWTLPTVKRLEALLPDRRAAEERSSEKMQGVITVLVFAVCYSAVRY